MNIIFINVYFFPLILFFSCFASSFVVAHRASMRLTPQRESGDATGDGYGDLLAGIVET